MQHCTYGVTRLAADAAPAAASLPRVDYADAFRLTGTRPASARAWALAVLEEAPAPMRATLTSSWRSIGLRPATPAQDAILEWAVSVDRPERLVLARASRVGMPGELVFEVDDGGLLFGTLVHHAHPAARLAWAAIVPSHVRIVERLLAAGAERLAAVPAGGA